MKLIILGVSLRGETAIPLRLAILRSLGWVQAAGPTAIRAGLALWPVWLSQMAGRWAGRLSRLPLATLGSLG